MVPEDESSSGVAGRLVEELASAWMRGERPCVEEILARHPELGEEEAIRLVYEEVCLREDLDHGWDSSEILRRFPQWRSRLALLLDGNRLLRSAPEPSFPTPGETLGDFRILAEIGRGALGRTFLASQGSLAERLLVLKVTALGQEEHLSLARLQHMHIVPLYFEQVVPERNVRVLYMPYLGGTTLARILEALRPIPVAQRTGRDLLAALDGAAVAAAQDDPPVSPFRKYLARASYVESICWLGACLADALGYAHDRGLVHMDVKPSNVLVAGDGQPMLLDFHLARGPVEPGLSGADRLGGTTAFMSPEQAAAYSAICQGLPIPGPVDGRSDEYSLGVLLDRALGGRDNPRVSTGLGDILRKCLATSPADRYAGAAALADDLRRHLNDLPLRGVRNRSLIERWRKWRRRRPAALARGALQLAAVAVALTVLGIAVVRTRDRAREVADLRRGLREKTAADLNRVVNLLRFRTGPDPPAGEEAGALLRRGLEIWNLRGRLATHDSPAAAQIKTDLLDLATICAGLRVHQEGGGGSASPAALRDAVGLLDDALRQYGPSPALVRDLQSYAAALGSTAAAGLEVPEPRTAWEHYDLGRSYLRTGEYARALEEFGRSADQQPGEFWPHFFVGVCQRRLERPDEAAAAFSICIALAPQTAECYFNRGVAYEAGGQLDRARADYSRALEIDPHSADAALNRGILAAQLGDLDAALADLERARAATASRQARGRIWYHLALLHIARQDKAAARQCLAEALALGHEPARALKARVGMP
jgi:tetratricopeptide (TPR) repeat protein